MEQENSVQGDFGLVGLGTMGSNLLKNIADHGYICCGYDKDFSKVDLLNQLDQGNIHAYGNIQDFAKSLKNPKVVMLSVPAGKVVDLVIAELVEVLSPGDIIIDGGNSHYTDTERRYKDLEEKGFLFLGMGISGGEEGARKGPSMMPGGDKRAYDTVEEILKKIAAHVNGDPTVAYMGTRSSGHFVKMVHNGIEYAIMQLISETYEIMRTALKMSDEEMYEVYKDWNEGRLQSYLLEITRDIFHYKKPGEKHLLLNNIRDEAKALGTGKWTSQAAMDLGLPIPIIDIAVSMRNLSRFKDLRVTASGIYPGQEKAIYKVKKDEYLPKLKSAYYFGMVSAYAQGMHLLYEANINYKYNLNLDTIAKIWRGGCIIRSEFLESIYDAYNKDPKLKHLFLDYTVHDNLIMSLKDVRAIVSDAVLHGVAVPAFSTALSYFDNFRCAEMPANLIMAQRDYFGSHTYQLIDKEGVFHTQWVEVENVE